ncbi:MAG TPA: phage holin family protein [Blastocatellia bacterium]|nr:phage holin family protein [Blastocatellia bacterium]
MIERERLGHWTAASVSRESIGELVGELAVQSANLVRDEIALASQELRLKGKRLQPTLLILVAGATLAFLAAQAFCATIILWLTEYWRPWQSALLVCGVLALGAVATLMIGIGKLKQTDLKPRQTLETLEENKEWLKEIT